MGDIVRQGRCTLVTTMQIYKILALTCLVNAYCLSVLYLDGVKYGDKQMTVQGMLSAALFFLVSRAQPLDKFANYRPPRTIFTLYMFLSVVGQFAVHLHCIIGVVDMSHHL